MTDEYILIGFVQKMHGLKGEVKLALHEPYSIYFHRMDRVFIDIRGNKVPFFISELRGTNDFIVTFEDVSNRNDAEILLSKQVFIRQREWTPFAKLQVEDDNFYFTDFVGYTLCDMDEDHPIGLIKEVLEYPQQEMAVIEYQEKDILIPLHEDLFLEIDEDNKRLIMDLPEGILEL